MGEGNARRQAAQQRALHQGRRDCELSERFGWQPYPQKHYESRFTRFYEGYWPPKKFGYDKRRAYLRAKS